MLALAIALAKVAFVYGGRSLAKRIFQLLSSGTELRFLWCAANRCYTLVDTETTAHPTGQVQLVTHCLLWSMDRNCDQQCIRAADNIQPR